METERRMESGPVGAGLGRHSRICFQVGAGRASDTFIPAFGFGLFGIEGE